MNRGRVLIGASLVALYVIWGSTYFAMRVSLEGFPPLTMAAIRMVTAGAVLFAFLRLRGVPMPTRLEWRGALVTGVLLLTFGNGGIALAERTVSSSFAAMVVASMPLWAAAIGLAYGTKPTRPELVGLAVGFAGVVVLNFGQPVSGDPIAFVAVFSSPIMWAWGSVLSRRLVMPKGAMASAAQMIAGGLVLVVVGLATGEHLTGAPSTRSIAAVAYLIVFGSLVAFSAYGYLLQNTRPAIATSYAYVNPIVAILLGVLFGNEVFTARGAVATLLTLGGVFLIARSKMRSAPVVAAAPANTTSGAVRASSAAVDSN
jgi:drug/metabolite transporter (DMT)-like permease